MIRTRSRGAEIIFDNSLLLVVVLENGTGRGWQAATGTRRQRSPRVGVVAAIGFTVSLFFVAMPVPLLVFRIVRSPVRAKREMTALTQAARFAAF